MRHALPLILFALALAAPGRAPGGLAAAAEAHGQATAEAAEGHGQAASVAAEAHGKAPSGAAVDDAAGATGTPGLWKVGTTVDWHRRFIVIEVTLDLKAAGLRLPEGRLAAERMTSRDLVGLAKASFFALPVDSRRSVEDSILDGTVASSSILDLAGLLVRREDSLTKDLSGYRSVWELPLGAVMSLYLRGGGPTRLSAPLSWKPTKAWSGIVIYADAPLPVHGERGVAARLREGLLPRVFDSDLRVLVDRSTVRKEALLAWGPLAYSTSLGAEEEERVGTDPLRIRATGLFGTNRTDLVIPREDAERILALEANRKLVEEGRILVIIGR